MEDHVVDIMISEAEVMARVDALAGDINRHFAGTEKLVVIGLLRGSFVFIADLARRLDLPVEIDFIEASSYGDGTTSSREVRILKDLRGEIAGRDVLVVEDIVDTGHTLAYLIGVMQSHNAASVRTCALLHKPARKQVDLEPDYLGFTIPDEWVVGYGLDYAEQDRTLPYIGRIDPPLPG